MTHEQRMEAAYRTVRRRYTGDGPWKFEILGGPGQPRRVYNLQPGDVFEVTAGYTWPVKAPNPETGQAGIPSVLDQLCPKNEPVEETAAKPPARAK